MKLKFAVTDTEKDKHWENIRLMNPGPWAYPSTAAYAATIPSVFDKPLTQTFIAQGVDNPDISILEDDDACLILCRGMQGYSLAERYISAATDNDNVASRSFGLRNFSAAADLVFNTDFMLREPSRRRLVMIGHSYGGGVITSLILNANRNLLAGAGEAWTYGSPRSWLDRTGVMRPGQFVRCCLPDDPVPHLVPHVDQFPTAWWYYSRTILDSMSNVIHPRGAVMLSSDGQYTYEENPTMSHGRTALRFGEWMISDSGFASNRHNMTAYANAAFMGLSWGGGPANVTVPQREPQGQMPTRAERARAVRQMVDRQAIETSGNITETAQRVIAQQVLVLGKRYYCETLSGRRCVSYDGTPVAWTTTRRKQVKLKNQLNKAIGM